VGRDSAAAAPCGIDDQFEFVERECRRGFGVRCPTVIRVDLYPVRAFTDLIANNTNQTVHSVGFLGALRNAPFGCVAFRGIAARGHDRARYGKHAWPRYDALRNRVAQADIGISRSFRSKIPNGGETGEQRVAQMICRSRHAQCQCLVGNLIVP
jgi:hypothetical protein